MITGRRIGNKTNVLVPQSSPPLFSALPASREKEEGDTETVPCIPPVYPDCPLFTCSSDCSPVSRLVPGHRDCPLYLPRGDTEGDTETVPCILFRLLGSYRMIGEAKGEFRQALSLDPGNTSARFHLARVYLDLGRIRKARETLEERLEITEKTPELLSLLGEVNRQSGDPRLSIRQNESAAILDPDLAQAHYYLGLAHLDKGDTEEALSRLERAIAAKGATSDMVRKAGSVYLQEGALQKAVDLLRKAVEISPAVPEGRLELARALRVTGQPDSALAELDAALSHAGGFSASGKYLGFELDVYLEQGRAFDAKSSPEEAIRSYLRVVELDPGHGEAHHRLARLFALTGDPAKSRKHASRAGKAGYSEPAVGR